MCGPPGAFLCPGAGHGFENVQTLYRQMSPFHLRRLTRRAAAAGYRGYRGSLPQLHHRPGTPLEAQQQGLPCPAPGHRENERHAGGASPTAPTAGGSGRRPGPRRGWGRSAAAPAPLGAALSPAAAAAALPSEPVSNPRAPAAAGAFRGAAGPAPRFAHRHGDRRRRRQRHPHSSPAACGGPAAAAAAAGRRAAFAAQRRSRRSATGERQAGRRPRPSPSRGPRARGWQSCPHGRLPALSLLFFFPAAAAAADHGCVGGGRRGWT